MLKAAYIACTLMVTSAATATAADPRIQTFHDKAIAFLAEISEPMFAGEGEGSSLAEKIISPDDIKLVKNIQKQAETIMNAFGDDAALNDVVDFANKIVAENNRLKIQLLDDSNGSHTQVFDGTIKGKWKAESEEDDSGKLCYASIEQGAAKVGFYASPGKEINAFIAGIYQGETRTNWQVDRSSSYELNGIPDDYFGWLNFSGVNVKMLVDVSKGRRLEISINTNKISVELNGSSAALSDFASCYLPETGASLPKKLPYGSRVGMEVDVIGATGIDTDLAEISVEHTEENAATYCREYELDDSKACINRTLKRDKIEKRAIANCQTGNFTDLFNHRFRFEGRNRGTQSDNEMIAEYAIRDLSSGELLDSSPSFGYPTALAVFSALCPSVIEKASIETNKGESKKQECYFYSLTDETNRIRFKGDGENTIVLERNGQQDDTCVWARNDDGVNITCNKAGTSIWTESNGEVILFNEKWRRICE